MFNDIIITGNRGFCSIMYINSFLFHRSLTQSECSTSGRRMVALSLKICVRQCNVVKTMQFEPATAVYDACRVIRERVPEAKSGQG